MAEYLRDPEQDGRRLRAAIHAVERLQPDRIGAAIFRQLERRSKLKVVPHVRFQRRKPRRRQTDLMFHNEEMLRRVYRRSIFLTDS